MTLVQSAAREEISSAIGAKLEGEIYAIASAHRLRLLPGGGRTVDGLAKATKAAFAAPVITL